MPAPAGKRKTARTLQCPEGPDVCPRWVGVDGRMWWMGGERGTQKCGVSESEVLARQPELERSAEGHTCM